MGGGLRAAALRLVLLRDLRKETPHISIRHLTTPHEGLRGLVLLASEIDALFAPKLRRDTNAAL